MIGSVEFPVSLSVVGCLPVGSLSTYVEMGILVYSVHAVNLNQHIIQEYLHANMEDALDALGIVLAKAPP